MMMFARADFHRALVVHAGPMRAGVLAVLASLADLRQRATALIGRHASLHIGGLCPARAPTRALNRTIAANNLEDLIEAVIMICLPIDFAPIKMMTVIPGARLFPWSLHAIGPTGQPGRKPP
ncbi:MAG: hypothetical protein ACLPJW_04910 [Rhodomicrobium sp.]